MACTAAAGDAGASDGWLPARPVVRNATTGDFTGDGYADYADHDATTGAFYVHQNLGVFNGLPLGFAANGVNWKVGNTAYATLAQQRSSVMIGDFDGDGFTDYADHDDASGKFFVHLNDRLHNGGFSAAPSSPNGQSCGGSGCQVLVADFTGDGCADYADLDVTTGTFYVHQNLYRSTGAVSFAPSGQNWVVGHTCVGLAQCDTLVGDFNGDSFADIAQHNPVTGAFAVYPSLGAQTTTSGRGFGTSAWGTGQMCAASSHCEELVADFNGDHRADYADHDWTTGATYVHLSLGAASGSGFQAVGTNYLQFTTGTVLGAVGGQFVRPGTGVVTEGVGDFSTYCGNHGCDIPNAVPNAAGFWQNIQGSGAPNAWALQHSYSNNSVYDTDFYDPELTSSVADDDTDGFDTPSTAISYFAGHGINGVSSSVVACSHDSDCQPAPAGYRNGLCQSCPSTQSTTGSALPGMCRWDWARNAVVSSTASRHGNRINYGSASRTGGLALGESGNATWDAAGANGNTNLVIWDVSFGAGAKMWSDDLIGAAAGAHLFGTLVPVDGDTSMVPDRGAKFAARAHNNPAAGVADSWLATMADLGGEGHQCGPNTPNYGYGGMNGCGCNVMVSFDASAALTQQKANYESWSQLQSDALDASGNGWVTYRIQCNYNTTGYAWSMP